MIMISVPSWPVAGVTAVIFPSVMYSHASASVMIAPVLEMISTSPVTADSDTAAITTIELSLEVTIEFTLRSASLTEAMLLPPPSSRAPEMVTREPC